jgi:hypothetical protein
MSLTQNGGAYLERLASDRLGGALPAGHDWLHVDYRNPADHLRQATVPDFVSVRRRGPAETVAGGPERCWVAHTAASVWLSHGVSLAKVAAYLGDTKEVVLAIYAHFLPSDDERARETMGAFFSGARASDVPGVNSNA